MIIGPWYPWGWGYGYGYYPYASYYYDDRYYDDYYASNEYPQSEYGDVEVDFNVSEIQSALARAGYYDGAIDGSLGPATRNALRRYQRDRGLSVTGRIDRSVVEALRLR
ncbi:MAG TPA: peptidoglycan-binding domain-containing protein [Chthoniobacterales bacterium]|nr:peptidoglycan-binding domain-containing protein [Chthoniobacterales bacterium]